ncbi:MAG: flavin reductase family protein [Pseudomonadota bacterium]
MNTTASDQVEIFRPGPENTRTLRHALGRFATGVTVIATQTPDGPVGMTANSFASVSLNPALVLWCIDKKSDRFAVFSQAERYAVHVLSCGQESLSSGFAHSHDHFSHITWKEGADGVPEIPNCLARFDCQIAARHAAGDHLVLIGRVLEVQMRDGPPLIYSRGAYTELVCGD